MTDNSQATASDTVTVLVQAEQSAPTDVTTITSLAQQWLDGTASQRASLEPQLRAWSDVASIGQIIETLRPKGTSTVVGKVYNQSFTLPEYVSKYADQ
ncbi:MAG: hypothetical protein H6765_08875 [Candidatus Peribacteria bacterium]|nr:MAG: hypothetical protein H6765_08875 [Candidatus Peribacteria bacterium]